MPEVAAVVVSVVGASLRPQCHRLLSPQPDRLESNSLARIISTEYAPGSTSSRVTACPRSSVDSRPIFARSVRRQRGARQSAISVNRPASIRAEQIAVFAHPRPRLSIPADGCRSRARSSPIFDRDEILEYRHLPKGQTPNRSN
jgi:hypothetical protein